MTGKNWGGYFITSKALTVWNCDSPWKTSRNPNGWSTHHTARGKLSRDNVGMRGGHQLIHQAKNQHQEHEQEWAFWGGWLHFNGALEVEDLKESKWLIYASHGVHWDCKGQTGAGTMLGQGSGISSSTKQKNKAKSMCKSKIVGVDDCNSMLLLSLCFMQAQGINIVNARIC